MRVYVCMYIYIYIAVLIITPLNNSRSCNKECIYIYANIHVGSGLGLAQGFTEQIRDWKTIVPQLCFCFLRFLSPEFSLRPKTLGLRAQNPKP